MGTIPRGLFVSLLFVFLLCVPAVCQGRSMQLLAPNVGWALAGQNLYWTTDGGNSWKEVTPPLPFPRARIVCVFFRGTSNGWVLLAGDIAGSPDPRFDLATTTNAGERWSVAEVDLSGLHLMPAELYAGGSVYFTDSLHGWLDLGVTSNLQFQLGNDAQD